MDVKTLERNYQASKKTAIPQKKRSSLLTLLPSALAAGASLIPGVGTGAAAILGGAGEAGSELLSGQKLNLKKIGTEAALSAIPGGLGKIGKVRSAIKGTSEIKKTLPATGQALKSGRLQIPVKDISTTATGKGVPQSTNKLLINPSVGDVTDARNTLTKKGYSVNGKAGTYSSPTLPSRTTTPTVNMTGTKTAVKLQDTGKPTTAILPGTGSATAKDSAIANGKDVAGLTPKEVPDTAKTSLLSRIIKPTEPTTTKLAKTGAKVRASGRGIQAGDKLGKEILTEERATELNKAVSGVNKGLASRSIRGQVRNVQKAKAVAGQAVTDAAKASQTAVSDVARAEAETAVTKGRSKILGFDENNTAHAGLNNRYATRLSEAKTPEQILEARRAFDQAAKKVYTNPDATQTVDKELAAVYRKQADKLLAKTAPEVKAADKQYSLLSDAEKALTSKSSKVAPGGIKPFGTSINGKGFGGGIIQSLREGTGKVLEGAGSAKALPTYTRSLTGQAATRVAAIPALAATDPEAPTIETPGPAEPTDPSQVLNYHAPESDVLNAQPDQTSQINDQLQQAALQALASGDTKGLANIATVAKLMESFGSGKSKPPTTTQVQQANNANSGLMALKTVQDELAGNPHALLKGAVPTEIGKSLSGAGVLNTARKEASDVISRLRTGAAINKEEEAFYKSQLPQFGDPPNVIEYKLGLLNNLFSKFANPIGAGADLSSLDLTNAGAVQ
jgi:hypothetical protein